MKICAYCHRPEGTKHKLFCPSKVYGASWLNDFPAKPCDFEERADPFLIAMESFVASANITMVALTEAEKVKQPEAVYAIVMDSFYTQGAYEIIAYSFEPVSAEMLKEFQRRLYEWCYAKAIHERETILHLRFIPTLEHYELDVIELDKRLRV